MSESPDKIVICFDATELDNEETCPFKWDLFHHKRLVPKHTKHYLESGSILHFFLEEYYKQKKITQSVSQDEIERIIEAGRVKSLEYETSLEEVGDIIFQFREYHRHYESEVIIPVHIEEPFMVKLYEDDDIVIYISGKPDLTFKYPNNDQIIVMDHKKVNRDTAISPMRNQFKLYATALGTDTVIVNKVGFQKTKKPHERFLRAPFVYSPEILEEWKKNATFRAKEMLMYIRANFFPMNESSCEKWDGCWYQRYCTTRPKAREFLIGSEFVIREQWDASKKLEAK